MGAGGEKFMKHLEVGDFSAHTHTRDITFTEKVEGSTILCITYSSGWMDNG